MTSKYVNIYKTVAELGELKTGKITTISSSVGKCEVNIKAVWSYRNIISQGRSLLTNDYVFDGSSVKSHLPTPISSDVILSSIHDNGTSAYLFLEKEKHYLFISSGSGKSSFLNIEELELHGKVYADALLSSFLWSKDGTRIVYVAEKKISKAKSFFTKDSEENSEKNNGKGEENRYIDDWGEQMIGQNVGTIAIANVDDLSLKVMDLPENYLVGEVCWSLDGKQLYGVAFVKKAFKLGLIYCPIRESVIFTIDMDGNFKQLHPTDGTKFSVQFPRLSPNGKSLAFLRNPACGPHVRSAQLCVMDLETEKIRVIIDYVDTSVKDANGVSFYGLYGASDLAKNCWCSDSRRMFVTTFNYYESTILLVDTETCSFTLLPSDCSQRVLDVKQDFVLISRSSLVKPPQLLVAAVPATNDAELQFIQLNDNPDIDIPSVSVCRRLCENVPHPGSASDLPVPYLYLGPTTADRGAKKRPLIALLHGGPHSLSLNSFSVTILFFLKLGYSFVIPNYRGSLGQGKRSLESLPGNCGKADILDVYSCVQHCLAEFTDIIDEKHINFFGGSHGGFLVCQLAAQYPDFMHRIVTRNPVTDCAGMQISSDIPDWLFTEIGGSYEFDKVADVSDLTKMFVMSPLGIVDKVKAPIMFQLSKNDRRVAYQHGLQFHKKLLVKGIKTEAFLYDDVHPLSKVEVEADCMIHTARWFAAED